MLSGLVKNHFESSHSPLRLCKLILSVLYETQKTFHQREAKNVALLFVPHSPHVSMNYLSVVNFILSQQSSH